MLGLILSLVGMGMEAGAGIEEGFEKQKEALQNEKLAKTAAADAVARGAQEAARIRTGATKVGSMQKVAFAAGGVDATVGTPVDVMADSRMWAELDAKTAENNAAREAWGFKVHGTRYAEVAAREGTRTGLRTARTILGGAGRASDQYGRLLEKEG